MKNVTYKVLVANGSGNLTSQVNLHLQEGWEVEGGVSVTNYYDKNEKLVFQYTQAILKYDA